MRVALIHDWLNGMRGGEKVFEVLCELYPDADVFTLFYEPEKVSETIRAMRVHESPLGKYFPGARKRYRYFLPILPRVIEAMPVTGYDLVISTSHCVAKGVRPKPHNTPHICYCFTPMRYVWEKYDDYFSNRRTLGARAMSVFRRRLQEWDVKSAARVTEFMTTSEYVRSRIQRYYNRDAQVVPAPVDCYRFEANPREPENFFLIVSALEPYKRIDIAVEAFNRLGLPLKIAGTGTQRNALQSAAKSNIEFLGWISDDEVARLYSRARAVIFTADEDFGIVPLEAAAAGCPVIAYGHGGALETIIPNQTGLFFAEQTAESLASVIQDFDPASFDQQTLRAHARQFDRETFKRRLAQAIDMHCR